MDNKFNSMLKPNLLWLDIPVLSSPMVLFVNLELRGPSSLTAISSAHLELFLLMDNKFNSMLKLNLLWLDTPVLSSPMVLFVNSEPKDLPVTCSVHQELFFPMVSKYNLKRLEQLFLWKVHPAFSFLTEPSCRRTFNATFVRLK